MNSREMVSIEMKVEHIRLLDKLKNEYGAKSRGRVLELLLDDLLQAGSSENN